MLTRSEIRRIMVAVNEIDGACALLSKKIGIKENTLTLFYVLGDGLPHSQKEICEEWLLPKTTLNTIVRECVEAGYLTLSAADGSREKTLCLTPSGNAYAARILGEIYRLEDRAAARCGLTPAAAAALFTFAQNMKKEANEY